MAAARAIYTCSVGGHDWIHRPLAATPGAAHLRFADAPGWRQAPWQHRPLRPDPALSPRLLSRRPKILGHEYLPGMEVSVWVDSSVVILTDLTPLIETFLDSGAEIALFRHPSGRGVAEEIAFALEVGRIRDSDTAEAQRDRYGAAGLLDRPVTENTILFRRPHAPRLRAAMQRWWHEVTTYTDRDQVSLAWALDGQGCRVHEWDWHFDDAGCPWFRRLPHRPRALRRRILTGAHFLADHRIDYRLARSAIRSMGSLSRRVGLSLPK